jgi:hypothetical protein
VSLNGDFIESDKNMTAASAKKKEAQLDVNEDAGVLTLGNDKVEVSAAAKVALEVGQLTAEGIYIGCLKDESGVEKDYFAAPTDVQDGNGKRLSLNFNDAAEYAQNSTALGHNDWVVPTGRSDYNGAPNVLNAMFNNKSTGAFKGTFDQTGSDPSSWYGSSSPEEHDDVMARAQHFSDGDQLNVENIFGLSVRLVRSLAI